MSGIRKRLERLEETARQAVPVPPDEGLTDEQFQALPVEDKLRVLREELNRPCAPPRPMTAAERGEFEAFKLLPPVEKVRVMQEKLGLPEASTP